MYLKKVVYDCFFKYLHSLGQNDFFVEYGHIFVESARSKGVSGS